MPRHFDDLMLGTLELFCCAAELQSFTRAAKAMNISPAAVSKTILRLEQKLGSTLFLRSTRHIRLTEAGEQYLSYCKTALQAMYTAEETLLDMRTIPAGKIRISLPNDYAFLRVFPLIPEFRRRYPQIELDFRLRFDITRQHDTDCDVILTAMIGSLSDRVAKKVDYSAFQIVASPEYLRRSPPLTRPEDLQSHCCIQIAFPSDVHPLRWPFIIDGEVIYKETGGPLTFSEDAMAGYHLAINGAGVALLHDFVAEKSILEHRLEQVLKPFSGVAHTYFLVCTPDALKSPRVRALTDFLEEKLKPESAFPPLYDETVNRSS